MAEAPDGVRAALKQLPSVDQLLLAFPPETYRLPQPVLRQIIRDVLKDLRATIRIGQPDIDLSETARGRVAARLEQWAPAHLRQVLNGTGVVLHTNLGRAPLSGQVLDRAFCAVSGYSNLEFDLPSGKRGERLSHVGDLLAGLTGSDGAVVVNNNAAAVLLMLNTVADGREVIISRGQQVEIGGSFRIPDVIAKAGAHMVEVGTTNRTHLKDYERAISSDTAAILFVHPSNYRIEGFTKDVPLPELAALVKRKKLPLLVDLGSGALLDEAVPGHDEEPAVYRVLKDGATMACFSGDKLLGGPQAGILVGKAKWLKAIAANPLYRALRCDKLTLALLEETLRTYSGGKMVSEANLTQRLLARGRNDLKAQARGILKELDKAIVGQIDVVDTEVEAGSGSLPQVLLPSIALKFSTGAGKANNLAAAFRGARPPVVGYVHRGRFYIDLKAIPPEKNDLLVAAVKEVFSSASG